MAASPADSAPRPAALITGGGTGVGRATALALARLGYALLINYSRSAAEAEATCAELRAAGSPALPCRADVAEDADCRALVAACQQAYGRLDLLVNSAGTTRFIAAPDLDQVTTDDWQRIMAVNLLGPFQLARAARPLMLAGGGGQIIHVSSIAALTGRGSSIPYAASKAALNNLTLSLARTLAPHIRVNAVAPGFITGRWLERGYGPAYPAVARSVAKKSLTGRVSTPDDVAAAILSLVTGSPQVTGQILVCDGGALLGP
jgi:3-oxoacyl-[acyl-carrier protein] reductase